MTHDSEPNSNGNSPSDETPRKRPLSEISHLFLSSIRDRPMGEFPVGRPQRTPPGQQPPPRGQATPPATPAAGANAPRAAKLPPIPNDQDDQGEVIDGPGPDMDADLDIDLTPEEFAQVLGEPDVQSIPTAPARPPVSAVIAAHLNGKQTDRVKDYARHLAGQFGRIGLIELDGSEFRLSCFEPGAPAGAEAPAPTAYESYDARQMTEALEEMSFDVDRWLLLMPNVRSAEARALLREVDQWALLSTCDHDGVVSSYRMLKGLAEARRHGTTADLPPLRVTLALLDGAGEAEMARVVRKLSGVCQQFLDLSMEAESPVRRSYRIAENLVMCSRPTRDKAQMANPPQWAVVARFLAKQKAGAGRTARETEVLDHEAEPDRDFVASDKTSARPRADAQSPRNGTARRIEPGASADPRPQAEDRIVADVIVPIDRPAEQPPAPAAAAPAPEPAATLKLVPAEPPAPLPISTPVAMPVMPAPAPAPQWAPTEQPAAQIMDEVLELPGPEATPAAILAAVLRQNAGSFAECPVRAPMCADAVLAVGRDQGVLLLAVARRGLAELRSISEAYQWLQQNLALIGMAVPQFALDPRRTPRLRLLVDQADVSADNLRPILQNANVTLQAYRKVRWGGRTGLLLEAA